MIAQASAQDGATFWGALGMFVTVLCVQIGKLLSDSRKDRRDLVIDKEKQEYLRRIAESNEAAFRAQLEVKTTLVVNNALDKMRHDTLLKAIESMGNNCKELNKPKT